MRRIREKEDGYSRENCFKKLPEKNMKKFQEIRTKTDGVEYLKDHIYDYSYVFDGFELVPRNLVKQDPLHRRYHTPRYNDKTKKFVTSLGGDEKAEVKLLEVLDQVDFFRLSPGKGIFKEDAFELKASVKGYDDRLYIKVFYNIDRQSGTECPIVVFHD